MTDDDLDKQKPAKIENPGIVDLNTMEPVPGGLFDPKLVGGKAWGYVELDEPVPNPAFEDAVRSLLGLKKKDLEAVLSGQVNLADVLK